MNKETRLEQLCREYAEVFTDRVLVFGDGCRDAELMLIGEAPGKDEVAQGRPFVGMAGRNLNEFLSMIHLERSDIFITNVIKYKLSKVNPKTGRESNRPAQKDEILSSLDFLYREISVIRPRILVTLGNVPLKAVVGDLSSGTTIGAWHGQMHTVSILENAYQLYPLYHPASIIYNQSLKEVYKNDVANLKACM